MHRNGYTPARRVNVPAQISVASPCRRNSGARWPTVNATYARVMGAHRPARAIVPVAPLHSGAEIEIHPACRVGKDPKP